MASLGLLVLFGIYVLGCGMRSTRLGFRFRFLFLTNNCRWNLRLVTYVGLGFLFWVVGKKGLVILTLLFPPLLMTGISQLFLTILLLLHLLFLIHITCPASKYGLLGLGLGTAFNFNFIFILFFDVHSALFIGCVFKFEFNF